MSGRNILFVRGDLKTALKTLGKPVIVDGDTAPALPYYHLRVVSDASHNDWSGDGPRHARLQVDSWAATDPACAEMDDAACNLLRALGYDRIMGMYTPPEAGKAARRVLSDFRLIH